MQVSLDNDVYLAATRYAEHSRLPLPALVNEVMRSVFVIGDAGKYNEKAACPLCAAYGGKLNAETLAALEENNYRQRYSDLDQMFADILAENEPNA